MQLFNPNVVGKIFLVMLIAGVYSGSFSPFHPITFIFATIISISSLFYLLIVDKKFTEGWKTVFVCLLCLLVCCLYIFGLDKEFASNSLTVAIIIIATLKDKRSIVLLLAMIFVFLVYELHTNYMYGRILCYIALFIGVKGTRRWVESYLLNEKHLKELKQTHQLLQEAVVSNMQNAVLHERNRIARDMHDALGHHLTSMIVQLQALKLMIDHDAEEAKKTTNQLLTVSKDGLNDIRKTIHALADEGKTSMIPVQTLLDQMQATTHLQCEFYSNATDLLLPTRVVTDVYRIIQEAATNTLRHANATKLTVHVMKEKNQWFISVIDNGRLKHMKDIVYGFGLTGIKERVEQAGGTVVFSVAAPHGFKMEARLPLVKGEV